MAIMTKNFTSLPMQVLWPPTRERDSVFLFVRLRVCLCVCVCVIERERERESVCKCVIKRERGGKIDCRSDIPYWSREEDMNLQQHDDHL